MHERLTNEEIARVFARYPGCKTRIYDVEPGDDPVPDKIEGAIFIKGNVGCEHTWFEADKVKITLKPLHHLNYQELLDACRVYDNTGLIGATGRTLGFQDLPERNKKRLLGSTPYSYLIDMETGAVGLFKEGRQIFDTGNPMLLTQYYYSIYVDLPVYFEARHWANGKTAIQLGIAEPDLTLLRELANRAMHGDKDAVNQWFFEQKLLYNDLTKLDMVDSFINEFNEALRKT